MTWKAMSIEQLFDVLEFWDGLPWPLDRTEAFQRATELGWVVDSADGMLHNPVNAFTLPAVQVVIVESPEQVASVSFWVSDVLQDPTPADTDRLSDDFATMVKKGRQRWGRPRLKRVKTDQLATWDLASGARLTLARSDQDITADYYTPFYAGVLRELGE